MATVEHDRINREAWTSAPVLDAFARREGWMDAGEAFVMRRVADVARGGSVLDIGVGAGRTLPYLNSLAAEYVAIDYLEEMVKLTGSRFPGVRVEHGDARDLSGFGEGAFDLVVFSFNGIDGLAHEDRRRVFSAVHRVLRPGGTFAYSTHNLEHRCAGRPPWHRCWFSVRRGPRPFAGAFLRLPRRSRSYRRLRGRAVQGDGWAVLVDSAYDFSVLWHHVTLEEAQRELRAGGFDPADVCDTGGSPVRPGDDTSGSPWLHCVATKPPSSGPRSAAQGAGDAG